MWETNPLSALCDVLDSRRKPITKKDRSPGPYPYYGATGILDYVEGYLFDEKLVLIGEDGAKWGAGDNSAFSIDGKTWVNNHAHVIRPKRNKVLDKWLIYYLNGEDLSDFITGMTVPKLNQGKLREIPIPLPPIPEQQRIVAILDQAFADIEKARANAEKNLKNARELFDSYLNLHLLDVCTQARTRTLDTMCELIVDCEHKTAPIAGEGYPSIRTPNIGKGHLILDNVRRVSQETYNLWTRRAAPVGGDLILAREAPAGNVGVIPDGELVCLGQRTVLIRPDKANIDPKYLAMFLLHPVTQTRLLAHSTGATVQHINMKDIRNLAMPIFPEMQSQNVTVKRILKAQALAQSLHDKYVFKLESLDELKKSLLQKAFSGELTKTEGMVA